MDARSAFASFLDRMDEVFSQLCNKERTPELEEKLTLRILTDLKVFASLCRSLSDSRVPNQVAAE